MKLITLHRKVDAKPIYVSAAAVVLIESRKNEMVNDSGCYVWIQSGGTQDGRLLREVMEAAKEVVEMVNEQIATLPTMPITNPPPGSDTVAIKKPSAPGKV